MKKGILIIGFLFIFLIHINSQDITQLLMNKEIVRIDVYINGLFAVQDDYVKEYGKIAVYSRDIQSMQKYKNREYIFDDSIVQLNHYYKDGYQYLYTKYSYLDGLLKTYEYEDFERGNSGNTEYFYNFEGILIREVGTGYEKNYSYMCGNINLIDEISLITGEHRSVKVEQTDSATIYSPCFDLYIPMDRKIIANRISGEQSTTIIQYFLDEQVFEEQIFLFLNDRIESIIINNHWNGSVIEYKFFFEAVVSEN